MRLPVLALLLTSAAAHADTGSFKFEHKPDRVEVTLDGKPFTAFHYQQRWDKPFLWPIRTARGTDISRGWPIAPKPGETEDHNWHRGFWWGHGDINGQDFWREKPDRSTSRLVADGKPKTEGSTLEARLAMMTPKGKRMGTVTERFAFSRSGGDVLMETTLLVAADAGEPFRFGDTDDGGFAFRLSDEFRQERGARLVNSEKFEGTEQIWGKPARWVDYSAAISGGRAGVTIIDHPSNVRHPSRWHARGYSLNSANPFAVASFTKNKSNDGSYTLPAGETLRLRYLVVIHDGDLAADRIEQYFRSFAAR